MRELRWRLSEARTLACGIQEKLKILVLLVERLLGLSALWPGPGRRLDCGSKVRPREAIWVRESGEWIWRSCCLMGIHDSYLRREPNLI